MIHAHIVDQAVGFLYILHVHKVMSCIVYVKVTVGILPEPEGPLDLTRSCPSNDSLSEREDEGES